MKKNYSKYIDHTILRQDARQQDVIQACEEAIKYDFKAVFVNPCFVRTVADWLKNTSILTGVAIGFPLGATTTATKVFETKEAIQNGAQEIDVVVNISLIKDGMFSEIEDELKAVHEAVGNRTFKVIFETVLLTDDEIIKLCEICSNLKVDYVKTSTGFSRGGATVEAVTLMRKHISTSMQVKAAGGIKTKSDFINMIDAGATRIGTSSGIAILESIDDSF